MDIYQTLTRDVPERSGALISASYAANYGRDVFATPSPIFSSSSKAPNILLKQGAKLVTESQDILEEYNLSSNQQQKTIDLSGFNSHQQQIIMLEPNQLYLQE